ncbi:hypothetical protein RRG08_050326 [Elysia crispata]|uniref:G-protein coupled receptors family 1 profile domain-containing protein n=1 Tax=Elysia crispata TaxID=231223 RepID=A0AAE0ZYB3_9GAST|nr:hypothetical protein RRG08_050326 [Elysia crispata]
MGAVTFGLVSAAAEAQFRARQASPAGQPVQWTLIHPPGCSAILSAYPASSSAVNGSTRLRVAVAAPGRSRTMPSRDSRRLNAEIGTCRWTCYFVSPRKVTSVIRGICSPGNFSLLSINSGSGVMANISGGTYLLNTQPTNLLIINASDIPLSTENYSKFESALTPAGDIIVAVYLVLLEFFAVLFNGFVIGLSIKKRRTLKTSDTFVVFLAVSDIGHPLLAYPLIIASSFRHAWIFGDNGCMWNGFTGFFFGINSMMTLAMMSLNRLIIITHANFARRHGKLIAFCLLGVALAFALFWSLSPVLGWGEYGPEPYKTSCTLVWETPEKSYVTASFVTCLALPALIMFYSYGKIVYLAALMRHKRLKWANKAQEKKLWEKKEIRLLKITGVMCFTFLLFWTPYAVVAMIKSYANHVHVPVAWSVVPALAAKTSHVIDPLIYCALNRNFSQHIPLLFKSKSSKLSEREFTTQSIPLKTIANIDEKVQISSEA